MKKVKECVQCGKQFISTHPSNKYCSKECRDTANVLSNYKKQGKEYIPAGTIKTCVICGKEYPSKNRNQVCCSAECVAVRRRQQAISFKERKAAGLVVPRETQKKKKRKVLTAKEIQTLHDNGMTYAEYQIAKTRAMIPPIRTVI